MSSVEEELWGADPHMNAMETLMWRSEVDPRMRSSGVLMEVLDSVPDRERFRTGHDWASRRFPRFRQRVVEDPLGLAAPRWVVAGDFDLSYHLRTTRLTGEGTLDEVLAVAQVLYMTPLDRSRPLWEAMLVEGLAGGRAAYLLKLHHSLADGAAIVQLLELAHSDRAEPGHATVDLPMPVAEQLSGRELAARTLVAAPARTLRGAVRGSGALAAVAGRAATDPGSATGYVRSLGRVLGPPPSPGSPLFERRSARRRLGVLEVPLTELRAPAKLVDGSLNDAFVAAMVGGVGRYHRHHGVELETLTLALPVSMRRDDDPLGSNRFAGTRIAGPAGVADPLERMRLVGERVRAARAEPALDFLGLMSPSLSRLPGAVTAPMTSSLTRSIDLQASNIPGLSRATYLSGARVTHIYPFGAIPGPAMMATLMSHEGTCCIGVTADAAAVTDFDGMMGFLAEGLDEIRALG